MRKPIIVVIKPIKINLKKIGSQHSKFINSLAIEYLTVCKTHFPQICKKVFKTLSNLILTQTEPDSFRSLSSPRPPPLFPAPVKCWTYTTRGRTGGSGLSALRALRPVFGSQHPHQLPHNHPELQPQQVGCPLLASMGYCTHMHMLSYACNDK